MKHIEDIEKLEADELIRIAEEDRTEVPDRLKEDIADIIAAKAAISDAAGKTSERKSMTGRIIFTVSAAAACLMMFFMTPRQPEDTFDDPKLAYAELEKTFSYISSKMDKGMEIAAEARPAIEKTSGVYRKK